MAFSASELTAAAALAGAAAAIVIPIWSKHLEARAIRDGKRPDEIRAITERYTALMDRQTSEREHLERQITKLETVAADLEVMVIKLQSWKDEIVLYLKMRGHNDFPRPPKFNGGVPGV